MWQGNPGKRTLASEDGEQRRIAEARVKTGDFIARLMMAYAGFAAFCVFTLLSPDRLVFVAKVNLEMPFAGNVSFLAFMVVAPALLIGMRFYLEVYVQHWRQLDSELDPETEPKTVSPLKHPRLRYFSNFVLYPLLPPVLVLFAWKAAAKDGWGEAFLFLSLVCATTQAYQFVRWHWSRRAAQVVAVSGSLLVFVLVGVLYEWGLPHRGLNLAREDLEAAVLAEEDLRDAVLVRANLTSADLAYADLRRADLRRADLTDADLTDANLTDARLTFANLTNAELREANLTNADLVGAILWGADLTDADLTDASLTFANLTNADLSRARLTRAFLTDVDLDGAILTDATLADAERLTQKQLDTACIIEGGAPPILPEGLMPPQKICTRRPQ